MTRHRRDLHGHVEGAGLRDTAEGGNLRVAGRGGTYGCPEGAGLGREGGASARGGRAVSDGRAPWGARGGVSSSCPPHPPIPLEGLHGRSPSPQAGTRDLGLGALGGLREDGQPWDVSVEVRGELGVGAGSAPEVVPGPVTLRFPR